MYSRRRRERCIDFLLFGPIVPDQACGFLVLVEVRFKRESFVALRTAEIFIAGMCLHVRPQIGPVGEGLAAVGAAVGFFSGVRSEVSLEQPRPRELLAANAAAVRQLVREQMHRQGRHADVGLTARHALLGRLRVQAAMGLLMTRQVAGGGVLSSAFAAGVSIQFCRRGVGGVGGLAINGFLGLFFDDFVKFLKGKKYLTNNFKN